MFSKPIKMTFVLNLCKIYTEKMNQTIKLIFLLSSLSLASCSNMERLDTSKVKGEMENFKIKRVTPVQINEQVERMGSKISEAITKDFEKEMKGAKQARIEELCQLKNIKLIDSLTSTYKLDIRLLGQPDIGSNVSLFAKEKEVLEAYAFDAQNKKPLSNNIQKIGDSLFVYTAPMPASNGVGKMCYSDDSGFALWSIVLKKSEVIKLIK